MVSFHNVLAAIFSVAFTAKNEGTVASGGDQYIHRENSDRQQLLHQCFRQSSKDAFGMSGILDASKLKCNPGEDPYRILEIGCGAGHTTLDLLSKILPDQVHITAVDADSSMIATAKERHRQEDSMPGGSPRSIDFLCQTGESLAVEMPNRFDAVWLRFVVVHVPDPNALLKAAVACLKPGGVLLVEDTYTPGTASICDPPFYAHTFFHEMHAKATRKLGGDLTRGAKIGKIMRDFGLKDIQCNSFAPIFGRGINIKPWTHWRVQGVEDKIIPKEVSSFQKFHSGFKLFEQSLTSLMPKLLELEVCSEEELKRAQESLATFQASVEESSEGHQVFSLPDGTIFQWWGTKQN